MARFLRPLAISSLALVLVAVTTDLTPAAYLLRRVPPAAAVAGLQTPAPTGRVIVKFHDDTGLAARAGELKALGAATTVAKRLERVVTALAPGSIWQPRFAMPAERLAALRRRAHDRGAVAPPDLAAYAVLETSGLSRSNLVELAAKLAADPAVETAFLEPVAVPAALGFDAFASDGAQAAGAADRLREPFATGGVGRGAGAPARRSETYAQVSDTPDFEPLQGYLTAAPDGVDALAVRDEPGARGTGVRLIDIEGAWLWTHEDLPDPFVDIGVHTNNYSWRQHGTAVLGVVAGMDNGYGVTGIVPDCEVGASSVWETSPAEAILAAADTLAPGDVILIELHAPGPNADGIGQRGYICMEFWQDNFDAIQLATTLGIVVVEASGNGGEDLDDPVYLGLFDRGVRDSGAILVGASNGALLEPAWFSNHGSRLDLHGWGFEVVTCGYGALQGEGLPEERYYTNAFNGTSSASPIVAGSVAALQGMARAAYGIPLDARLIRDILRQTGTPQTGAPQIGPRPNLPAAEALLAGGIGELVGTVTAAGSGEPLAGILVRIGTSGAFDLTDADGGYRLTLLPGLQEVSVSSFFYEPLTDKADVLPGETTRLDLAVVSKPRVDIVGTVFGAGTPLPAVSVTPIAVPLPAVETDLDGGFLLADAPVGPEYALLVAGAPGYGAGFLTVPTAGADPGPLSVGLALPAIAEDFETAAGYVAAGDLWSRDVPPAGIPGSAFSGDYCWGVGMDGLGYADDAADTLTSVLYDLSTYGSDALFFSFHYYAATEPGFDGVNLWAVVGTEAQLLEPLSGYTDASLGGIDYEPGWSGDSEGWRGAVFDLTSLRDETVRFQWVFGSDGGANAEGFFIDGVAFDEGGATTSARGDRDQPPGVHPVLAAFPNPFNPRTTIAWRIATAGELRLAVYDLRGRLVRVLHDGWSAAGADQTTWDGRDASGHTVASGVYLVQLRAPNGGSASRRVVLAK
jgi:hypothetical protein